jgi:hypothetical protein
MIQSVSQVRPASAEKACCQRSIGVATVPTKRDTNRAALMGVLALKKFGDQSVRELVFANACFAGG